MKVLIIVGGVATAVLGCGYDANLADCTIHCAVDGEHCPGGMTCGAENLCRPTGTTEACSMPDANTSVCMNFGDPIVDLAVFQPATADAYIDAGGVPSHANDSNDGTRWTAASDGNPGHWWQVDLGAPHLLANINTLWELDGVNFKFFVSTSSDGTNFTTAIDQTADTRTVRARMDAFPGTTCARYVRVTKTDTTGYWAILYTVNVLGR